MKYISVLSIVTSSHIWAPNAGRFRYLTPPPPPGRFFTPNYTAQLYRVRRGSVRAPELPTQATMANSLRKGGTLLIYYTVCDF